MSTEGAPTATLEVGGIQVSIIRKAVKNLHLAVYPPDGWVRAAVPLGVTDEVVRSAVIDKLRWIRQQQATMKGQPRQGTRELVSGETHFVLGKRYRLDVIESDAPALVRLAGRGRLALRVPPAMDYAGRLRVLNDWYRTMLRDTLTTLIAKWEPLLGVEAASIGIKRMKTKWGSCNTSARRVWFNLELAKKDLASIEYVVVHELSHLIVRHHDARFVALMDRYLPRWRAVRDALNAMPLAEETWPSLAPARGA
jgi:hypothetical protein